MSEDRQEFFATQRKKKYRRVYRRGFRRHKEEKR